MIHLRVSADGTDRTEAQWYGKQDPQRDNRIIFDDKQLDIWGLPSLSFACKLSKNDNERCERIYADMIKVSHQFKPYSLL